jgi:AcrR family transcriptional regulator
MRLPASERRQAIIQAAIRLFSEKGFRGTTTRELAAAVGVSEPVIYQHFAAKKDLYAAIIESKTKQASNDLECWSELSGGDDRSVFLGLGRMIWAWFEDDRSMTRLLFFSALEGIELADMFFNRHASEFLTAVSTYIRKRIKAGAFLPGDPETLAWTFIGMVGHYAESVSVFRFDPKPRPREVLLGEQVDLFLRGVLKDQNGKTEIQLAKRSPVRQPRAGGDGVRRRSKT